MRLAGLPTQGAQSLSPLDVVQPWARAIWSLGRTVAVESGERMQLLQIDCAPDWTPSAVGSAIDASSFDEAALRGGAIFVPELVRVSDWPKGEVCWLVI